MLDSAKNEKDDLKMPLTKKANQVLGSVMQKPCQPCTKVW